MNTFPVDLEAIATIWMVSVIVLVPLLGLTARFAAVPVLDALTRWRLAGRVVEGDEALAERLRQLEEQLARMARRMERHGDDAGRQAA